MPAQALRPGQRFTAVLSRGRGVGMSYDTARCFAREEKRYGESLRLADGDQARERGRVGDW